MAIGALAIEPWGLIDVPVAPVRSKPSHAAEQVTQGILGNPVRLDSLTANGWYAVEMPDGYHGYIRANGIRPISQEMFDDWRHATRYMVLVPYLPLQKEDGSPDGYATMGAIVPFKSVELKADHSSQSILDMRRLIWSRGPVGNVQTLLERASTMLGNPYIWGGTSSLGPDCSGFTQMLYKTEGWLLPRDTSEQILCGQEVEGLENALPGDLLFFAEDGVKVDHVGLYLGDGRMINSSGRVCIYRLTPDAPGSEPLYQDPLIAVRRILGVENPAGVQPLGKSPWYSLPDAHRRR